MAPDAHPPELEMNILRLFGLFLFSSVVASSTLATRSVMPAKEDFYLEVTIVTGEHSRDSNSVTRTITVTPGELTYKETYAGARSNRRTPVSKQFTLTKQDQADLIALLKAKNLLITKTMSRPPTQKGSSRYFELAITSALEGRESSVAIEASPSTSELKTDSLYQGSVSLIEQIYKIINRTDPDIEMPTLVD
jgi:hypothetical protein